MDGVHNLGTRFIIGVPVGLVYNPVTGGPDEVTNLESAVGTKYDGLWVTVRRRFGSHGEFYSAYTLAKAFNLEPAVGIGLRRDCFTLQKCVWARRG